MLFHPDKCNVISFSKKRTKIKYDYTLHGQTLLAVDSTKYLGLNFSEDLTWNAHIGKICAKANRMLGFLKRNLKIENQNVKSVAYKSMVRPLLEYSSTVWHPHQANLTSQIESVQNRAARWVTRQYDRESSVTAMKSKLEWPSLNLRRQQARIILLYKIVNGLVLCPTSYFVFHRGGIYINPIHARTDYYKYSFFPDTIYHWNTLPVQVIQAPSLDAFKGRLLKEHLSIHN